MICRVCDSSDLEPVIDLGKQPWGNHFLKPEEVGKEPVYPLRVVFCRACTTAQLDHTVAKEVMFSDHTYRSGMTKSLDRHFAEVARNVDDRFFKNQKAKSVLDIGSNDGTQLKHYKNLGYDVLGVEPAKAIAAYANQNGIKTANEFFNQEFARAAGRKFDVIGASGVFFHLEELHSVTEGIRMSLSPEGVFVVQFLYMRKIIQNCAFDQIYHEHLLYYNLRNIQYLLARHGLELFDAELSPIHGGSVIGYAGHKGGRPPTQRLLEMEKLEDTDGANRIETYLEFAKRIERKKLENNRYLKSRKAAGKLIYGLGAPVKGNTLLNYFGIGKDLITCLVEINTMREGLTAPGSHIPVVMESEVAGRPPDVYYVLAWNFKDEILKRYQPLVAQGVEFYFPVET